MFNKNSLFHKNLNYLNLQYYLLPTAYCLVITLFFTLPTATHAGILESYTYGEPNFIISAHSLGMGGTFIAVDISSNPASFAYLNSTLLSIGFESNLQGERRSKKAFDSFDNTIGDVTISDNGFLFLTPTPFVLAYPFTFGNMVLQIVPKYNFDYRYERVVRDDYYVKIKDIYEECDGKLWAYSIVFARQFGPIGAGIRYDYINGRIRYEKIEYYVDPEVGTYDESYESNWSGWDVALGLNIDINSRLRLALFYNMGTSIEKTNPYLLELIYPGPESNVDYPATLGFGIKYKPANQLPATLNIDVLYTSWKNLDLKSPYIYLSPLVYPSILDSSNSLNNIFSYHLGVEHLFSPETKLRFGFAYIPSYLDKSIATAKFTFGCGFLLSGFEMDIGTAISRRLFNGEDVPTDMDKELFFEELGITILT
ncbi:hypothetical protein KAX35_07350, partial [candidate division WOR-3 bacterium]|nr:hypothetical protein [candidate division WOR-3 bacterium]